MHVLPWITERRYEARDRVLTDRRWALTDQGSLRWTHLLHPRLLPFRRSLNRAQSVWR